MDVEELKHYIAQNYDSTTLNMCSRDDSHNVSLIPNYSIPVYNFDDIKSHESKHKCFPSKVALASPDSIYINTKSEIKLIEFKNTKYGDIYKPGVRAKLYESIILLERRFDFNQLDKLTYILVHKDTKKKPKTHRIKEGKCPNEFSILKVKFPIEVQVYEANVFERKCHGILGHM